MEYLRNLRDIERNREILQHDRPVRGPRDRSNPFEMYNDEEFRARYRFTKQTTVGIIDMLEGDLRRDTQRNAALPAMLQVLTALRFYAVGEKFNMKYNREFT